ncbi:hypothetical protein J1N35_033938 [Gossypium stocksii]|uniref:Uncharacterized protein n=1 Tax=Gossypium stocksii TaxID=47602 RepID=A0A9D3UR93_9ROSI|nr:hypothetical protein J1N35_033938 [Gossypium stocksii]
MINYQVKHKEINLSVEHEIGTVVVVNDESMLAVACLQFGGEGEVNDEVVDSKYGKGEGGEGKCEGEGGEVAGSKDGGESAEGLGGKGDDITVSEGGESDGSGEKGVREVEGKPNGKCKETVLDETKSESSEEQFEKKYVPHIQSKLSKSTLLYWNVV